MAMITKLSFFLQSLSLFSDLRIDHKGLNLFLAQGNIPAPFSIFKSISKLEPGTYIEANSPSNFHIRNYWSIDDCPIHNNTFDENYNVFQDLFLQSVESQMISDVSLGAFLSGGLDSSAVVSAMKEVSSGDIDTHTIGYEDNKYDESNAASAVAKHLGTKHHEFILSSDDAKSIIPQLSNIYCEPFSDSSQIPTFSCQNKQEQMLLFHYLEMVVMNFLVATIDIFFLIDSKRLLT